MKAFKIAQPKTVEGAIGVAGDDFSKSKMLAGGTDLVGELKERTQTPDLVVNLKSIPGLNSVKSTSRGLEIGALVTLTDLAENKEVARGWPALTQTTLKTATPQVRNTATVGGNLCQRPRCWYYRDATYPCLKKGGELCYAREGENEFHAIFDNSTCNIIHPSNLAPALMVYGALMDITGPDGTETLPVEEFWVSPEEDISVENILEPNHVVTRIILPKGSESSTSAYLEVREKQSYDWSICGSTVNLILDGGKVRSSRIVLSAVAPTPVRRTDLEEMINGKSINEKLIKAVCDEAVKDATPQRDNQYKTILVKATLSRAIRRAMKG